MGLRDALNEAPPAVRAGVIVLAVGCIGVFAYMAFSPGETTGITPPDPGEMTQIRCTNCGATAERNTAELVKNEQIDPLERVRLIGEAGKCAKCGKYTLVIVEPPKSTASK